MSKTRRERPLLIVDLEATCRDNRMKILSGVAGGTTIACIFLLTAKSMVCLL